MDEEKARKILDLAAEAYSDRGVPGLSDFAKTRSGEEGELVLFCIGEMGSINTKGSNTRLYSIDKDMREGILKKYLALK